MQQRLAATALVKSASQMAAAQPQHIRTLDTLSGESLIQAKERLLIIQPLIDFAATGQTPLCGEQIGNISSVIKHLAATQGQSERTVWNWWTAYKQC